MNDAVYLFASIAVMAGVTYLIRVLPLAVFRRKIQSKFVLDFLYYVPYAVLAAMTIPAVFSSSNSLISAAAGFIVAVVLSFFERGLRFTAVSACAGVFLAELLLKASV